jgi:outer membrane protein OmpA-like peptidoglycan-associated protein
MRLAGGKISFSDLSGSTPFKTVLDPVDLKVDHLSNAKDKRAAYALSLNTEAKEAIKVEGEFSMDPLGSEGMLEVTSVPLRKYSPFYRDSLLFDIEDGRLDLSARYRYAKGQKEPEASLSGISVTLNALRLKKAGEREDFVKVPRFSIKEADVDLTKRELRIGNLSTEKGEILVKRLRNGDLNLLTLTPPAPASANKEPAKKLKAGEKPVEPEKPWLVSLKQMLIDKYTIRVVDQTTKEPVTLVAQNLALKGENISTAKNSKARLSLSLLLNGKGTVSTTGTIAVEPLSADVKIGLKGIEIAPFQPYFTDKVKMTVTGGAISTNGNLSFASTKKEKIRATYKGEASVTNFSSIDKLSGEDLLKLESLSLNDLNVAYAPLSVEIKGVSLTNFYALVLVSPDGKINLQDVLAAEEPRAETAPGLTTEKTPGPARQQSAAAPPQGKEPSKNIRIDQVTLQDGRIDFQDKSVKPEFSTRLSEIGGRVSGLSADQNTTADVELRGKLNDYAPLEITGKINPLRDDLFVDIKARIKDMDLSPASPYSGKYAGYVIEKGKLSLDVKYSISKGKLDSQNNIVIDQFTFGEKIESPQATSLPVKLAVALLKDRKGEIKLDLPVTGSLNDPKFSVWQIIVHILVNLIAKAATSPFALLGAMFGGGGEELSYIEFDYGSTAITEPNMKKLDTVSKALQDRPTLKLDIDGCVDMDKDREGLKQVLFNRKIKAQKLNETVKKGQPAVPVDEVKIEPAEYEKYLKMAYKAEKFPKPKNIIGMAKDLPVPEMEKLMLTHTEVNQGDLRTLASQRGLKVEDVILKSGKVEHERVFVLEPKLLTPEKKEKVKESRVDLKLK